MTFVITTAHEHIFKWHCIVFSGDDDKKKKVKKEKKKGTVVSSKTNTPVSSAKATPSKTAKVTVEDVPEEDNIDKVMFSKSDLITERKCTFFLIDHRSIGKSLGSKEQGKQILQRRPLRIGHQMLHTSHWSLSRGKTIWPFNILSKQSCRIWTTCK